MPNKLKGISGGTRRSNFVNWKIQPLCSPVMRRAPSSERQLWLSKGDTLHHNLWLLYSPSRSRPTSYPRFGSQQLAPVKNKSKFPFCIIVARFYVRLCFGLSWRHRQTLMVLERISHFFLMQEKKMWLRLLKTTFRQPREDGIRNSYLFPPTPHGNVWLRLIQNLKWWVRARLMKHVNVVDVFHNRH